MRRVQQRKGWEDRSVAGRPGRLLPASPPRQAAEADGAIWLLGAVLRPEPIRASAPPVEAARPPDRGAAAVPERDWDYSPPARASPQARWRLARSPRTAFPARSSDN